MLDEEWRRWGHHYQVSSRGRVRALLADGETLVQPYLDSYGRPCVELDDYDIRYKGTIAKLLLIVYWTGDRRALEVEHKDGNVLNLDIDNLAFFETDNKSGDRVPVRWRQSGIFRVIDRRLGNPVVVEETGKVYPSANAAAKALNLPVSNIYAVLHGRLKTCGELHFSYK